MLTDIFKMTLGIEKNLKENKAAPKKEEGVIHPFSDAPVKIDFISGNLMGRYCPEYIAAPGGRFFTTEEEDILVEAMFDACIRYYCYPIIKRTTDSFEAFVVEKCREKSVSVKKTAVKKYDKYDKYDTLQKQLDKINMCVENTFVRNHPDRIYRYDPDREYLEMYGTYERNQAYKEFAKRLDIEKESREKEYEKYRSIWY